MIKFVKYSFLALIIYSCSSDDKNSLDENEELITEIQNNAMNGLWKISNYNDSGQDETSDYNGYAFNFGDDGVLTASKGADVVIGTWSVTSSNSNSSDDDGTDDDNDVDFNIFFNVSESDVLDDLVDDWDVSATTSTQISLFDISGGDGSTDILVFNSL